MNKSYFCSERVRLRAMEPEDLEVMYAMENDSQTWDVTNFTVPYSRFVLKQYIENSECDMFADRKGCLAPGVTTTLPVTSKLVYRPHLAISA